MILNIVNGRAKVATVNVTTTPSATVTCVNGTVSLSATASSAGAASFVVPKIGTWTITSTKGSLTRTGTVSVTAVGETKSISLVLEYYLFKDGVQSVPWTLDAATIQSDHIALGTYYGGFTKAYTTSTVSFKDYTKINFEYISNDQFAEELAAGYSDSTIISPKLSFNKTQSTKAVASIDITSETGSFYVHLRTIGTDKTDALSIYNVWLS